MIEIQSPYEMCPVLVGENLVLRLVSLDDAEDLVQCYSDPSARLLFNSDNCTNKFEYSTLEEMKTAIEFWIAEYQRKLYVRFAIVNREAGQVIGTIEFFTKPANDNVTRIGVLRIDLQSNFESEEIVDELVQIVEANFRDYFAFSMMVTKAIRIAEKRIKVFQKHGFAALTDRSVMNFDDYFIKYF